MPSAAFVTVTTEEAGFLWRAGVAQFSFYYGASLYGTIMRDTRRRYEKSI
jgi:hypothetical protein